MTTLLRLRFPGTDEPIPLAVSEGRFVDPDASPIDEELDTGGWWAIPGLVDAHAHLSLSSLAEVADADEARVLDNLERHAWMQLEGGVLLVLDKGGPFDVSLRILDADPTRRPALEMAGRIIANSGGYYAAFGVEVDEEGLADAVAAAARPPARWVKIIGDWPRKGVGPVTNFGEAALRTAVEVAHAAGARVAVHTMAPEVPPMAVAAGVDSIEHGTFLDETSLEALAARGGAWVPTVTNTRAIVEFLGPDRSGGRLLARGLENLRALLPVAEALGVTVLAGTDLAVPHGRVGVEALALRDFGLSTAAALEAVTTAGHRYVGVDDPLAPGRSADVVFVAADPLERLETILEPTMVLRAGRRIR
ncbi:MAG TPA: hypothetical protein ENK55_11505 [Actinobacteria bacterium]|nr:hypothetical protein [Actinomycetota bacterium]